MKLKENIVRINGYKDNKRTHIDITVEMYKNQFGKIVPRVPHFDDIFQIGFNNGLDCVTSYNYYNFITDNRMTLKVW